MYAIIETGGKQYKVTEGQIIDVDHLDVADGAAVEIDRVLLIADGDKTIVGKPLIEGAKVLAKAQSNGRGDKVIVFKFKSKVRYRRKKGHRQPFTKLAIDKILPAGAEAAKSVKRARRKKQEETKNGT